MEVHNPTAAPVSLKGWRLQGGAGAWHLPDRTLLPRQTLILTDDGAAFHSLYGTAAVAVQGLRIREDSDLLILYSPLGRVDHVAWGGGKEGWHMRLSRGSFCRPDPKRDTNTTLDWVTGRRATPAKAGCA